VTKVISLDDEEDLSFEEDEDFKRERTATQVLINTVNTIDNADGNVMAALYDSIQIDLQFSTEQLGGITTARALLQAISTPLWGYLADKFSRKLILAIGCMIWGIFTVILGILNGFWGMFFVRAFTGLGLAVIFPTAQSLVSDFFPKSKRGRAFGMLGLTTVLGAIVGTLFATLLSHSYNPDTDEVIRNEIFGMAGWRFVFIVVGAFSILLGIIVLIFGKDPKRGISDGTTVTQTKITWKDYKTILTNKTFVLIVLQGVAGTIPWNSMLFIVFWLIEIGFDPLKAGISFSMVAIGAAAGNLFGGYIGDRAAKWNPDKGRVMIAQISVFAGIPMMLLIFYIVPRFVIGSMGLNGLLWLFIAIGIVTGFLISWSAPAANNPIFSELFEPRIRGSAFAIDRLFEGSIAASGTYIVALFANRLFNYSDAVVDKGSTTNILALSNALLIATIVPWVICLLIYSFVYFSYPKDRDKKLIEDKKRINNFIDKLESNTGSEEETIETSEIIDSVGDNDAG
jgi:MFS family permease